MDARGLTQCGLEAELQFVGCCIVRVGSHDMGLGLWHYNISKRYLRSLGIRFTTFSL
ncbi:hypothetical protein Hanom_Chr15g01384471 [Helianthus anomalus]